MTVEYSEFLAAKVATAPQFGFEVADADVSPILKPHQRAAVRWMVRGGRRACFASFGLGKTMIQQETVRLVRDRVDGRGLITIPLGVRQEFFRDGQRLGHDWRFIRSIEEAENPAGLYLTNYETIREGKLDPRHFSVASLDEAAVLRGFGGTKTFREFMRLFAGDDGGTGQSSARVPYRFVATATPSPNEYIELLSYAAYLGIMQVSEAKTRFFKRDSTKADTLTIHPHKIKEFWLWVASWALFIQTPSDLGFDDEGYVLPPMQVHWHELPCGHANAGAERDGQSRLFRNAALGVVDAAREKRDSLPARLAKLHELRAIDPAAHRIIWHDLEAEREAIEDALPVRAYGQWLEFKDGNSRALELYERHYSARQYADGRERKLLCGPGEKLVLLNRSMDALFAWRKFIDDSGQQGVNCAVFRNEGGTRSSDLIREACAIARLRWPGERFYTYVDPTKVSAEVPGYSFRRAGWHSCGVTQAGQLILEFRPGQRVPEIPVQIACRTVFGSQDLETREQHIIDFADGKIQELAAKPVMLGSGCNLQRHCSWAVFLGIGFKFSELIQAIHRLHRFLQAHPVRIDLIYTEAEREVRRALETKWAQHDAMVAQMTALIREYGLARVSIASSLARSMEVEREEVVADRYRLIHGDAIEETRALASDSVGLIVTSIPFSTQYEYTPSYRDLGHTDDDAHFFEHLAYLTPELLRVLQPGRVAAVHVKDRIVPGGLSGFGFQTVSPFSDYTIQHFRKHGFAFLARKTIVTDVVRENNQTYRLGWTEQCKDGSRMGCGLPEYVLLFRKPPTDRSNGYADVPVVKSKEQYSRSRWQIDAHGFARSNGNRFLQPSELADLPHDVIYKLWREYGQQKVYDFEHHVAIGEALEQKARLPVTFMLLPPPSWHPDVWTDITRMRTMNTLQSQKGREMHLCPIQFDIVDRLITQFSQPDDVVFDPFGGLMTVPYCALKLGRRGLGIELNRQYFTDGASYCAAAASQVAMPTLFSLEEVA